MTALAHQHDVDEQAPDFAEAEAEMPAASFEIIRRAHAICDHPPAIGLATELEQHATKILSAMIRARALAHEMRQRGDFDLDVSDLVETDSEGSHQCEPSLGDDKTDNPSVDWASVALAAWCSEGWKQAAQEYHATRGKQRGVRQ